MPGDHIRAGALEIQPDLGFGAEYRTNVYRDESTQIPAADLLIRPSLTAAAAGDDQEFKFSGMWELRKYLFVGQDPNLSSSIDTSDQAGTLDRFNEFELSAGADTFKRNIVGFRLAEDMALHNFRADVIYVDVPYSSEYRNALGAGVRVSPGPALELVPGGAWTFESFEIPGDGGSDRALNNRNAFGPTLDAKWAFLPRTSLLLDASWMYNDWQHTTLTTLQSQGFDHDLVLPNSNNIRALGGLNGRFTDKLLAQVLVGYGVGLFDSSGIPGATTASDADATGWDGVLVQTQAKYIVSPSQQDRPGTSVIVGYDREFLPSFFTNFVQLNQVFTEFHGRVGRLEPSLRYELRFEDYRGEITRNDLVNRMTADLRLAASEWMSFTAGGWWQERHSYTDDAVDYDDVNLHLLATFAY